MISSRELSIIAAELEPDMKPTRMRLNFCKPSVNYATDKRVKTETSEQKNEYWEKYLKMMQDESI